MDKADDAPITYAEAEARVLKRFKEQYGDLDADAIEIEVKKSLNQLEKTKRAYAKAKLQLSRIKRGAQ